MRSSNCLTCGMFPCKTYSTPSTQSTSSQQCVEMDQHRESIVETLIDSEQHYILELDDLISNTIQPLSVALSASNQPPLHLNIHYLDELLKFHGHLCHLLCDAVNAQHRIGGIFLHLAPTLKPIFEAYCYQHAKTLFLFNYNKDRILNALSEIHLSNDHNNSTYIQLIKNLSLPVNRLEKYASLLKEYLYNLPEFHMDRGDAQRAAEYYGELAALGAEWRKRKEWELDIIHSPIHGLNSESLISFGDALCLSPVNVISDRNTNQMSLERIAILYPSTLFLLSTLPTQQEYQIENRFHVNQITISKIIDISKRALKINVPLNQSLIVSFPSNTEYQEWCEKFYSLLTIKSPIPQQISKSPPPLTETKSAPINVGKLSFNFPTKIPTWSKGCLRPNSPLRPHPSAPLGTASPIISSPTAMNDSQSTNPNENGSNRTLKRFMTLKKTKANEFLKRVETSGDDALLLSVIEAYCMTTINSKPTATNLITLLPKTRYSINETVNSANTIQSPMKSIDTERRAMFNMMKELRTAYKSLQQELEGERQARKQLESQIQRLHVLTGGK